MKIEKCVLLCIFFFFLYRSVNCLPQPHRSLACKTLHVKINVSDGTRSVCCLKSGLHTSGSATVHCVFLNRASQRPCWTPVAQTDVYWTHSSAERLHSHTSPICRAILFISHSPPRILSFSRSLLLFSLSLSPSFSTHNWWRAVFINQFGTHINQPWMEDPPSEWWY